MDVPLGRFHIRHLKFFPQEHLGPTYQDREDSVPIILDYLPRLDWFIR